MKPSVFVAAVICIASRTMADDAGLRRVADWACEFRKIESARLTWDLDFPVLPAGESDYAHLRLDSVIEVRWPDYWRIAESAPRREVVPPSDPAGSFVNLRVRTPKGERLEFYRVDSIREVSIESGFPNMVEASLWYGDAAPLLVGKWICDIGLPQDRLKVIREATDEIQIEIAGPELLRMKLSKVKAAGMGGFALSQIQVVDAAGQPEATTEFSDFRLIEGLSVPVGMTRTTRLPERMRQVFQAPTMPLERSDTLYSAEILPRLADEVIAISTSGFKELRTVAAPPHLPRAGTGTLQGSDTNTGAAWMRWGLAAGAAICGLVAIILAWKQRR